MKEDDLLYVLALQKVDGVGDVMAKKLIAHCGSAEEIFKTPKNKLASINQISSIIIKNLTDKSIFEKAENELQYIQNHQIQTMYFQDDNYPMRLKHCYDGPVLLFSTGNIDLENPRIISIVGTRQITSHGTEFCRKLISDLAPLNPIIVSGFAYGVDIVAHQAAMDMGLQTIAVVAHGMSQIYPAVHKKYVRRIEENGGFLTEFWSGGNPDKENFVRRNRIVAGMSEATIVIESAERGGSLITANLANDYNRDVFAVPGRTSDKFSQGCNNLIKTQKANLLTSAADVMYILNWELENRKKVIQKQLFITLEPDEQRVYDYMQANGKSEMDLIAIKCQLPIYKLSSILLNLELKGVARPLPGKMFEAI
ncbi:DNA-processing protein DprA [Flavobacterium ardleyense]|uniref:DNA-processing protein DprA n=1 Tax=Flavobacterium ardleyense TaxID=2038737 RepID=UPI00298C9005|nr:DNA-processing protein DprA [Flavobacterium ardleyense]